MDTNRVKLGLVYIFSESGKIGKASKLQLINFIENATEHQIKVLALDGEVVSEDSLDDVTKAVIDERYEASTHIQKSLKEASSLALENVMFSLSEANIDKINNKIRMLNHMAEVLRSARSKCSAQETPRSVQSCVKRVDKRVQKVKAQIDMLKLKISSAK